MQTNKCYPHHPKSQQYYQHRRKKCKKKLMKLNKHLKGATAQLNSSTSTHVVCMYRVWVWMCESLTTARASAMKKSSERALWRGSSTVILVGSWLRLFSMDMKSRQRGRSRVSSHALKSKRIMMLGKQTSRTTQQSVTSEKIGEMYSHI